MKRTFILYLEMIALISVSLGIGLFSDINSAHAAALANISDTMSSSNPNVTASHLIKFTSPSGIASGGRNITIALNFSMSGFDYTKTTLTYGPTTGAENSVALASSPDISHFGVSFNTGSIIYTSGGTSIPAGSKVIISLFNGYFTNPSAGTYIIAITANSDTGKYNVVILNDLISIYASVDPTIFFSISNTTLTFGSFAGINLRYADTSTGSATLPANGAPTNLVVSTNGANGVSLSFYDVGNSTSGGLWSSSDLIPAAGANLVTAGSKRYSVFAKNPSSLTIDPGFTSTGTTAISTTSQNFAVSTGPVISGSVDVAMVAAVDTTTPAGTYNDTVTIVCTGRY